MNIQAAPWTVLYGSIPPAPHRSGPGWKVRIPSTGSLNYVCTENRYSASRFIEVSIRIHKSPNAKFVSIDDGDGAEPNCRPIILASMFGEFNRWWPDEAFPLKIGIQTLRFNLLASKWTSVFGKPGTFNPTARRAFLRCKSSAQFGITFGGGFSYGHGVKVTGGNAFFELVRFTLA